MPVVQDVVRGGLKLNTLPDRSCFHSWGDFVEALPTLLSVEIPTSAKGVIAQQAEPSEDSRSSLWLRLASNGAVVGLYAFQKGLWRELPPSSDKFRFYWEIGDSSAPPDGFTPIITGDTVISS